MAADYKGASRDQEVSGKRRRRDTRLLSERIRASLSSSDGVVLLLFLLPITAVALIIVPFSGEVLLLILIWLKRKYINLDKQGFDFPYRVPIHAQVNDGSVPKKLNKKTGKKEWEVGEGITYLAQDLETRLQVYSGNSDLRTHMLVLGTTGSGKTEFLLGLVFNALIQNTGFIYVDGKGEPKLQKEIFRLARYLGREDDLLIINFITSGRDFIEKQYDKVTNNMNLMANSSSGMLIELIVALMDDSGSGGGDMWKGRAISFVASLTRPLIYLRDKGYINLSPEKYLEYFELNVIEELVFEHNGKYGEMFDVIVAPLKSYLITLPGYQKTKLKKQETKTLEQHGFIIMQLTRIFNDLTFNYGHIFKTKVGDVDFYDVVINRRCLVVLLPALERAPDSLRMLGKMIVGSIKQMMAGCLGNRVEGVIREIIDSRPTNAKIPFYTILDEYGYYAVIGFAVAPAQARSLGFSVIFAAQDFSSLKKSSAEEADATWENTNVRAVGRLTSGEESETWRRVKGAASEATQASISGFERKMGVAEEKYRLHDNVNIEKTSRIDYNDLAMQENGEFTLLVGKKESGGKKGGVRVIRSMGFYTASKSPKEMRINDLIPVELPEPADLPKNKKAVEALMNALADGTFNQTIKRQMKPDPTLISFHKILNSNYLNTKPRLGRFDVSLAALGWFLNKPSQKPPKAVTKETGSGSSESTGNNVEPVDNNNKQNEKAAVDALAAAVDKVLSDKAIEGNVSSYQSAKPIDDDEDIAISANKVTDLISITNDEVDSFESQALPILKSCLLMLDEDADPDDYENLNVADTQQMLDIEMAAMGEPFSSMEEKFDAEERIEAIQNDISASTSYPNPPVPTKKTVGDLKQSLSDLAKRCQDEVKESLH